MQFKILDVLEMMKIQGGGEGDIGYDFGWWLASKFFPKPNSGSTGGHF